MESENLGNRVELECREKGRKQRNTVGKKES